MHNNIIEKRMCSGSFGIPNYWNSRVLLDYHDDRWCKPEHDDNEIFATLFLEIFAAGLSWRIILEKESNLRQAFDNFVPNVVAMYNENNIKSLLSNVGIIRNIKKIEATINNAKIFLKIQKNFGSFNNYIWNFTSYNIIDHHLKNGEDMPARNELSDAICKDMKQKGFKFIGSITIYSFLQGIGIVNDHWEYCEYR